MAERREPREIIHDLRNYLGTILMGTHAIQQSRFDPALGEQMVKVIKDNIQRAKEAADQLSDATRDANS